MPDSGDGHGRRAHVALPNAFDRSLAWWNCFAHGADLWWNRSAGPARVAAVAGQRFDALVEFARGRSPYYRALYAGAPRECATAAALPVVTREQLMAHFDHWVTDPAIRLADVQAFVTDESRIGTPFLGRYIVWRSSGTTGVPGIFIEDAEAMATYDALVAAQVDPGMWGAANAARLAAGGARAAMIVATGDHFASVASWQRWTQATARGAARCYSVTTPLSSLVLQLNAFKPALLSGYPTVVSLLADEQSAGRLHLAPAMIWCGGECLTARAQQRIESAFGCPVINEYGASECLSIAVGCRGGWLHLNADWVLLEPVDTELRPTPPGTPSHTVLLTNLANRVQPIIRYDLGDSITMKPEPCTCGNALPAFRVGGRQDDMLSLCAGDGSSVRLPPLALTTVVEQSSDLTRFQLVQAGPERVLLRLDAGPGTQARTAAWKSAAAGLRDYLAQQGLSNVDVRLDRRPLRIDARTGKLRMVVVEPSAAGP